MFTILKFVNEQEDLCRAIPVHLSRATEAAVMEIQGCVLNLFFLS